MLDLVKFDLDEIASALSDQTDYEHRWLIDPSTGEVAFWTSEPPLSGSYADSSTRFPRPVSTVPDT